MGELPTGIITLMLTDIESSARMWQRYPELMHDVVARHDAILRSAIETNSGIVVKSRLEGDSFFAVFARPTDAVVAARDLQLQLRSEPWPDGALVHVRVAIHSGEAAPRNDDYFGPAPNRCARVREIAHGGQTLLTSATRSLVAGASLHDVGFVSLGRHRLRDLDVPEEVHQLLHPSLESEFPPLKSITQAQTNLPYQRSSFVGRVVELAEINAILESGRQVTLVGFGGCGKTRLAMHVGAGATHQFPDGVWFVDLATVDKDDDVAVAAATALRARDISGAGPAQAVINQIRESKQLLILDNCEHMTISAAGFIAQLLEGCPNVHIVATSRETIGYYGELVYEVPPLSLPDDLTAEPAVLRQSEAMQLLEDRVTARIADFAINEDNYEDAAMLVHVLDGSPLAIEIASPLVAIAGLPVVLRRVEAFPEVDLVSRDRTAPERHRSLTALITWSSQLLSDEEMSLFERLSVFAGSMSLAGIEAVAQTPFEPRADSLELLTQLVNKSLVQVQPTESGGNRYRLLWAPARFARESLRRHGDWTHAWRRHADFYAEMARDAEPELTSGAQQEWLDRLEVEQGNLLAALRRLVKAGDARRAQQLSGSLWRFWYLRGHLCLGRESLESALALSDAEDRSVERAQALHGAGTLAGLQGDYEAARRQLNQAAEIRRFCGDLIGAAGSMGNVGLIAFQQSDYAGASEVWESSLTLWRDAGDRWGLATALKNIALAAQAQGEHEAASREAKESLDLYRVIGDDAGVAGCERILGLVALEQGRFEDAGRHFSASLDALQAVNDKPGIAQTWRFLGNVALAQGDTDSAHDYYRRGLEAHQELGHLRETAAMHNRLGRLSYLSNELEEAERQFSDSRDVLVTLNAPEPLADALEGLGLVRCSQGDTDSARALLAESLDAQVQIARPLSIVKSLEAVAVCSAHCGDFGTAYKLLKVSKRMRCEAGTPLSGPQARTLESLAADAEAALAANELGELCAAADDMEPEHAVDLAYRALGHERADG